MLMANSVEGRFPFLDRDVMKLAHSLPPEHKLHVLDEKHVLKQVAKGLLPDSIINRPKQPYRAPDAQSFVSGPIPEYAEELLATPAVSNVGIFDPARVGQLWGKCKAQKGGSQFSNADNMALTGVLSTQLLHRHLVVEGIDAPLPELRTLVEY